MEGEILVQDLPVIIVISLATVAIISVLLWRVKPAPAVDTDTLNKRISEETQKVQTVQTKLDESQNALRDADAKAAAAQATSDAAKAHSESADHRTEQIKSEFDALQRKYNDAEPLVATATANMEAAEKAKSEVTQRFADLAARYNTLQTNYDLTSERATKAEKDCAAARSEAVALNERAKVSDTRLDSVTSDLNALHTTLNDANMLKTELGTRLESTEAAKSALERKLDALTQDYDTLQSEYKALLEQASISKADADHLRTQISDVSRTLETSQQNLTEEKAKLNQALAKLQTDEAAANQFKNISKTILEETLEQAKRSVGELAVAFQKSSGAELNKHADKITRTLEPLQAQLESYDKAVESLKKGTQENYGSLREQLGELQKVERSLHEQAQALTTALSTTPKPKGAYGELTLRRLVEFAGLQDRYHFEAQASRNTEEGRKIPDLVVFLPGGQKVIVDAKAVMDACVQALQTQDDKVRKSLLDKHSSNVKSRVIDLSAKNYFVDHPNAVEAVILFLPAEHLYSTAVENDPYLTEFAMERNIIICGPNALMVLLKVANQLWQRASIEEEAQKIKECGDAIYKAACLFIERYTRLGTKIQQLEEVYNEAAGTLNGNLIPKGRNMGRFAAVASGKEVEDILPIREDIRPFSSPEAKKILLATTEKLPGLSLGEFEMAELTFAAGGDE